MRYVLGIDPGLKGGLAFYDGTNLGVSTPTLEYSFMKNGKKKSRSDMNLQGVAELIRKFDPERAILEKVTARPGQGVTSMFRFGQNLGQYQGLLTGMGIPFTEVTPQGWKSLYSLSSDKYASLLLAGDLFPHLQRIWKLKKNDGLAEAALIARSHYVRGDER